MYEDLAFHIREEMVECFTNNIIGENMNRASLTLGMSTHNHST